MSPHSCGVAAPSPTLALALARNVGPREWLARKTIPENTRQMLESDQRCCATWKRVAAAEETAQPESKDVVARFIRDHSVDPEMLTPSDPLQIAVDVLIGIRIRRNHASRQMPDSKGFPAGNPRPALS